VAQRQRLLVRWLVWFFIFVAAALPLIVQSLALSSLLRAPSLRERGSLSLTASLPFPSPSPQAAHFPVYW